MSIPPLTRNLLFLFFILPSFFFGQDASACIKAKKLTQLFTEKHYRPLPLNDDFSKQVFSSVIDATDPNQLFFTQKDLTKLSTLRLRIDDDIKSGDCFFLRQFEKFYKKRLRKIDSLVIQLTENAFDYSIEESLSFSYESGKDLAKDFPALKNRWRKWLKYQTFRQLYQLNLLNELADPRSVMSLEGAARAKALQKEQCQIQQALNPAEGFSIRLTNIFMQAIATSYDPHSQYFSAHERESFESSLSRDAFSFGLHLSRNQNGDIEIESLIPGGSAWKSNSLNKGDVILEVTFFNGQSLDLLCGSAYEVEEKLESIGAGSASFTVKKSSGQIKTISLRKELSVSEENVISSFILEGEHKVGYIYLPAFYTEWEEEKAMGCSNDIAKEILVLQMEGIEGLILDLRYNGGGSMAEALALAGIFIDEGPLSIQNGQERKPVLLKDFNRGTIFDGPMGVMINGLSASASEIFAAALQDYQRAVIVGDTSYGKSSGQVFFPVSSFQPSYGYVKVTVSKFYRLNGDTHQRKGVIPDILLTEPLGQLMPKEADYPNSLLIDRTDKKVPFQPLSPLPIDQLAAKSTLRLSNSKYFQHTLLIRDSLPIWISQVRTFHLQEKYFFQEMEKEKNIFEEEEASVSSTIFTTANNRYTQNLLNLDPDSKEANEVLKKDIQVDPFIEETYLILSDLIKISNH